MNALSFAAGKYQQGADTVSGWMTSAGQHIYDGVQQTKAATGNMPLTNTASNLVGSVLQMGVGIVGGVAHMSGHPIQTAEAMGQSAQDVATTARNTLSATWDSIAH